MKRRIAVIGGGISGLSAAWYLQKHEPFDVHLFEGSHRLGGVIATDHREGRIIERGADNFATLIPDALHMTREMGFEDAMIHPNLENRLARVVHAGKIWPIPQGFSLMQPTRLDAIMASRILSWKGKLRVAAEYCIPARRDTTDESLKDFAVRRLGREAFERLVEPIVGGIFTAQADQLSMQGAMPEFVDMERKHGGLLRAFLAKRRDQKQAKGGQTHEVKKASGARYDQFVAPKDGMQSWLDQIIQRLNGTSLEIGCAVERIEPTSEGWWLHFHHRAKERFDGVVVALPAPAAASVLSMALPSVAVHLKAIPYASSAVVVMIVNRNEVDPQDLCFGIVVPQVERRDVLAISMTSEKYPGRVAKEELLLRVFIGGAVRPELFAKTDDELEEIAWNEARSLLRLKTPPSWRSVVRWKQAMPQYHLGHVDRIAAIDHEIAAISGLALAGNAYRGVGIPQCVRSGRMAAEKLAATLLSE